MPRRDRPVFDPSQALGWTDIALDGLSCYLRCVEAILEWRGFSSSEVATALVAPIDLVRRSRSSSEFGSCSVRWRNTLDGREHWRELVATVGAGEPVILAPDRYYWPGDEFERRRHVHDHMVLVFAVDTQSLRFLDTDAPREGGYVRSFPVDDPLRRACTRWGTLTPVRGAVGSYDELAGKVLMPSLPLLAEALPELAAFRDAWSRVGCDEAMIRALEVAVLGDFQPDLFLFGEALATFETPALDDLRAAAKAAAKRSKSLGLLTLALEREASEEAFDLSVASLDALLQALEELLASLARALDQPAPKPRPPSGVFNRRILSLARWCHDPDKEPPEGFPLELPTVR